MSVSTRRSDPAPKIFIVEDEAVIAMDLQRRLEDLGYRVSGIAHTAEEAVRAVEQNIPDLVLIDIRLQGGTDGIEAAGRIHDRFDVPIIYLTACADNATLQRAKRTEPLGYVAKPFTDSELNSSIQIALQRHTSDREIRNDRAWLNSVLRSIGDAVVVTDECGLVRLLNPVAERLTGWTEPEVLGRPFQDVIPLEDPESGVSVNPLEESLTAGRSAVSRFRLRCRNGARILIEDSTSPVAFHDLIRGGVFVFRENSARVHAEEKLNEVRRMESMGRLAGCVAHEFNNLLTVILGVSKLAVKNCGMYDPCRKDFETIAGAAHDAAELTRQLLAMARKQVLKPQPLNVNTLLCDMAGLMRPAFKESVRFELEAQARDAWVFADPLQLKEAILDIYLNARDSVGGTGTVLVGTRNPAGPGSNKPNEIHIIVRDTGPGLTPEEKARIFEPRFVANAATHARDLDLAVAYGIVTQSGGRIEVESEIGRGSNFTIALPLWNIAGESPLRVPRPMSMVAVSVLVVEDNGPIRKLEASVLSAAGMKVTQCPDGLAALRLLKAGPGKLDLIVTDVVMPDMNGVEFARQAFELIPGIRIIFVTGYSGEMVRLSDFPEGAAALLGKPFTPEALTDAVSQLLGSAGHESPKLSRAS